MTQGRWVALGVVVLALVAILFINPQGDANNGGGGDGGTTATDDERLATAMCNDLEDGMSLFQMHSQAVEHYRDGRSEDAAQLAAAELEDLATREYCPEFRDDFEATITYEEWIAP